MSNQSLETLIDEKELSRLLRVSIGTLRFWRTLGRGPRYRKVGQLVRYAPSEVQEWLDRRPSGGETETEAAR
jgi:predicted DNA-binding transcriptional regulator AlpA